MGHTGDRVYAAAMNVRFLFYMPTASNLKDVVFSAPFVPPLPVAGDHVIMSDIHNKNFTGVVQSRTFQFTGTEYLVQFVCKQL